jgi:ABC-type sugar transport system ATPase subunit
VVLRDGRIEQVGTPQELYLRPANVFVAQFIGSPKMNVFDAAALPGGHGLTLPPETARVGLRPEDMALGAPGGGRLQARLALREYTGASTLVHVTLDAGPTCLVMHDGQDLPEPGAQVSLDFAPQAVHAFDQAGNALRA